jgi:hypothetical protein
VVGFKKIKFYTNENVGSGKLELPENEMHTTAYWLTLPRALMAALPYAGDERRDGVVALAYTLGQLAALFLMCDRHDLGVALGDNGQGEAVHARGLRTASTALAERPRPGDDYEPHIFVYDNYPGGIGLSEPLYRLHDRLVRESEALITACACSDGCPSCVGPAGEMGSRGKEVALAILQAVRGESRLRQEGSDPHRPMSRVSPGAVRPPDPAGDRDRLLRQGGTVASVRAVVLGIAQDGGVPISGAPALCVRARRDPSVRSGCLPRLDRRSRGGAFPDRRHAGPAVPARLAQPGPDGRRPATARGRDPADPCPHRPLHRPHVPGPGGAQARGRS